MAVEGGYGSGRDWVDQRERSRSIHIIIHIEVGEHTGRQDAIWLGHTPDE